MSTPLQAWYQRQKARLQYRQGLIYISKKSYQRAIVAFDRALVWHPKPAEVYVMRGLAHWQVGDVQAALADYDRAITLDPQHAKAHGNRGLVRYHLGDEQGALSDWQTVLSYRPNYAEASYNRGLVYVNQKNYQAALADFDQALASNPNLVQAYFHRGTVRYNLGDRAGAVKDWELAVCNDLGFEQAKERLINVRRESHNEKLTQVLQSALAAYHLAVQAHQNGNQLDITIHRSLGVGINYLKLPDLIRAALIPQQLYGVNRFRIIGKVAELNQPEWHQVYGLYDGQPCPPSYWRAAILTTLLVFPPFGIPAMIYAAQVKSCYNRGDYQAALHASSTVKGLCKMGGAIVGSLVLITLGYLGFSKLKTWLTLPGKSGENEYRQRLVLNAVGSQQMRLPPKQ
ncbi:MAG: tetratricopeptide repeat protein [Cyanothece sp. SIO1E1]|nr:tetratricopeptide repeat protein [Cyanothece sp. SIO1E1]